MWSLESLNGQKPPAGMERADVSYGLQEYGKAGWELVSTVGFGVPTQRFLVFLKRPTEG